MFKNPVLPKSYTPVFEHEKTESAEIHHVRTAYRCNLSLAQFDNAGKNSINLRCLGFLMFKNPVLPKSYTPVFEHEKTESAEIHHVRPAYRCNLLSLSLITLGKTPSTSVASASSCSRIRFCQNLTRNHRANLEVTARTIMSLVLRPAPVLASLECGDVIEFFRNGHK